MPTSASKAPPITPVLQSSSSALLTPWRRKAGLLHRPGRTASGVRSDQQQLDIPLVAATEGNHQQFCGSGSHALLPSPREEDEEEPDPVVLLSTLGAESSIEGKLRRLVRVQSAIQRLLMQKSASSEEAPDSIGQDSASTCLPGATAAVWQLSTSSHIPAALELMTSLLAQELFSRAATSLLMSEDIGDGVTGGTGAAPSQVSPEVAPGTGDATPIETYFTEVQVLAGSIIADLCDVNVQVVGSHVWSISRGYLEDPGSWHRCLLGLELITHMSPCFSSWLLQTTDAIMWLVRVFTDAQQSISQQREATLSSTGRSAASASAARPCGPLRCSMDVLAATPGWGSRFSSRCADQIGPGASSSASLHGGRPPPLPAEPGEADVLGVCTEGQSHNQRHTPTVSRHAPHGGLSQRNRALNSSVAEPPRSLRRTPSCDDCHGGTRSFDGLLMTDLEGRTLQSPSVLGSEASRAKLRASADASAHDELGTGSTRSSASRPMRVPPLNLGLDGRVPSAGSVGASPCAVELRRAPSSMTRSSRRLRLRAAAGDQPATISMVQRSPSGKVGAKGSHHGSWVPGLRAMAGTGTSPVSSPMTSPHVVPSRAVQPQQAVPDGRASLQQGDDLAKALGEACLLADLSHLIKYKQERQVHDAVIDSIRPGLASPASACTAGADAGLCGTSSASQTSAEPESPVVAARSGLATSSTSPQPGLRSSPGRSTAGRHPVSHAEGQPSLGGTCSSSQSESRRHTTFRQARLHACLVLEQFVACAPDPAKLVGPHVPVNKFFEMLQGSCGRSGVCSFLMDEDLEVDAHARVPAGAAAATASALAEQHFRGVFQRLLPTRKQKILILHERLHHSATSSRCICGASAWGTRNRSSVVDEVCTCVDDVLASCMWRLLRTRAQYVEKLLLPMMNSPKLCSDDSESADGAGWSTLPGAWHTRLGIDAFLTRISRTLGSLLQQLRSAQSSASSGPEVLSSLQHRCAFLLRLCAAYLQRTCSRALELHAFHVLCPSLMTLKSYLCSTAESLGPPRLPVSETQLWVSYLQLVGVILAGGARSGATFSYPFSEAVLLCLLDFPPSEPASAAPPTGGGAYNPVSSMVSPGGPTPPRATPPSMPRGSPSQSGRVVKSQSLKSLHVGPAPRVPITASPLLGSPVSDRCAAPAATPPKGLAELIPRILERAVCDVSFDDSLAAKPRGAGGSVEDSAEAIKCRVFSFVECLLTCCQALMHTYGTSERDPAIASEQNDIEEEEAWLWSRRSGSPSNRMLWEDVSHSLARSPTARGLRSSSAGSLAGNISQAAAAMSRAAKQSNAEVLAISVLDWLQFMFLPPSGLLCRSAEKVPLTGSRLGTQMVSCEKLLFSIPCVDCTAYVRQQFVADYYVRRHFLAFVRLYNSRATQPSHDRRLSHVCCLHLEALLAIASLKVDVEVPRRAFHQLSVIDFLVGEIDLEHETSQMHERFLRNAPHRSSSAGTISSAVATPPTPLGTGCCTVPKLSFQGLQSKQLQPEVDAPILAMQKAHADDAKPNDPADEDSSDDEPPMPLSQSVPKFRAVPKLSFRGLRPSLQGSSGIGAPPPEEPTQEATPCAAISTPQARFSDGGFSGGPFQPHTAQVDMPALGMLTEQPQGQCDSHDVDSSDEDDVQPSAAPNTQSLPPAKLRAVPKLSFMGLRPSMQGSSGIGAPPPEEPGAYPEQNQGASSATPTVFVQRQMQSTLAQPMTFGVSAEQVVNPPAAHSDGEGAVMTPTVSSSGCPSPGEHGTDGEMSFKGVINQNIFYSTGRQRRRLYEDTELQSLVLTLILALLVTPKKGLLDPRYCDQYPLANHKRNIPFLLSLHLNHIANKAMLPTLVRHVEGISHIGGLRVLKLLCEATMHRWMYTEWTRIAGGSFGTVYQCNLPLGDPWTVAVKQMSKQTAIQDRCVFHDVFSEVICLDNIRFEENVCQLYDYGVDETGYWIVMRYYPTTLKKWRESLKGTMSENLPALLAVFHQVLRAVQLLHSRSIVHYDLKCDNIMLDVRSFKARPASEALDSRFVSASDQNGSKLHGSLSRVLDWSTLTTGVPRIAVVDFGESLMLADDSQVDTKNRGTELVKCPEMLELEKVGKREGVNYDRRRRVGTNRAADVWSVGCLLFEILTGRFLFQDDDFGVFWARVTGHMGNTEDGDVISQANCRLLEGNTPLIQLLKFILVRHAGGRPSIDSVADKFEAFAAEAMLVAQARVANEGVTNSSETQSDAGKPERGTTSSNSGSDSDIHFGRSPSDDALHCAAAAGSSGCYLTRVLHNLSVLDVSPEEMRAVGLHNRLCALHGEGSILEQTALNPSLPSLLAKSPWTHVIDCRVPGSDCLPLHPSDVCRLELPWSTPGRSAEDFVSFLPTIFDFLYHAAITRGIVLLVDSQNCSPVMLMSGSASHDGLANNGTRRGGIAMAVVLALIAEVCNMAIYPTLSYLNSQLLAAAVRPSLAMSLTKWQETVRGTRKYTEMRTIRVSCMCGTCSWLVPSSWAATASKDEDSRVHLASCQCGKDSGIQRVQLPLRRPPESLQSTRLDELLLPQGGALEEADDLEDPAVPSADR